MYNCIDIKKHITSVCLNGEYGDSGRITKFTSSHVYWYFSPESVHTPDDISHAERIFEELYNIIGITFIQTHTRPNAPHIMLYFGNQETFQSYIHENIQPNTLGYANWNAQNDSIYRSHVFVSQTLTGIKRRDILREEITQALGNTGDTLYAHTLFYQYKSQSHDYYDKYFEIDVAILRFLYHPHTHPGMTREDLDSLDCDMVMERCVPLTYTTHYPSHFMGPKRMIALTLFIIIICIIANKKHQK